MYLVKVGDRIINLEQLTLAENVGYKDYEQVQVSLADESSFSLNGDKARRFWEHVCKCAEDLDMEALP